MTVEELKESIINKTVVLPLVLVCKEGENFIVKQYIREIAKFKNLDPIHIDTIPERKSIIKTKCVNLFIYNCDEFSGEPEENTIVVCKSGDGVRIPELQKWMLDDYARGVCEGVKNLDIILDVYSDPNKLQSELDKLIIFEEKDRQEVFDLLLNCGNYAEISFRTATDLSNYIINYNNDGLLQLIKDRDHNDLTDMFVINVLHSTFERLVKIKTLRNPTIENTGCSSEKQLNFLKRVTNRFSTGSLVNIFTFLCNLDFMIRGEGIMTNIDILDYIVTQILYLRRN